MIYDALEFDHHRPILFVQTSSFWVCQGPTNKDNIHKKNSKDKQQEQIDTWIMLSYILELTFYFMYGMKGLLLSLCNLSAQHSLKELQMLSSVTHNCQITKTFINSGSQLSVCNQCL